MRRVACLLVLSLAAGAASRVDARVVSEITAQQAGLTRVWFTQAPVDVRADRVAGAVLSDGMLLVLSDSGTLAAVDAETGALRWRRHFGRAFGVVDGPTTAPGRVTVTIGTTAHVLDIENGAEIVTRQIDGALSGAPVVAGDYLFASMMAGRLLGYPLAADAGVRLTVASPGSVVGQPAIAGETVVWTTLRGEVYAANKNNGRPVFRYDAASTVVGPPVADGEKLYFATQNGFVYALDSTDGRSLWRRSVIGSVSKPVVHAGDALYVSGDLPALYALDAETGRRRWTVEGVSQFVSASETLVYAVAPNGALAVIDRASGRPIDSWPGGAPLTPVANSATDRLYFVSSTGLLQCFREEALTEPYFHNPPAEAAAEEAAETVAPAPVEEPAVDEGFAEPPADSEPFDPFGSDAGEEGASEDPFGDPFEDF